MFQSLINTRHCSSGKILFSNHFFHFVSILTQYKALFIRIQGVNPTEFGFYVSILTQYKALFIWYEFKMREGYFRFNPYSIQGIVHLNNWTFLKMDESIICFNPYSIQGIVHHLIEDAIKSYIEKFQSLLNTRHCSSVFEGIQMILCRKTVSILTQYKALFISQETHCLKWFSSFVSILTQYKALFINKKEIFEMEILGKVSILTQYKALFISSWLCHCRQECSLSFNPYSIQGIVHHLRSKGEKEDGRSVSILTQYKALFIIIFYLSFFPSIPVSILTQYKALFITAVKFSVG